MKNFLVFFMFIPVLLFGQWKTAVTTTINEPYLDKMGLLTNRDGNHILLHEANNSSIKYYLLNAAGTVVRSSTIATSGDFPNIVGNNDKVYAIYKSGSTIQAKYSTDAGANWTAVNSLSINSTTCNGVDAAFSDNGIHIVYALKDANPAYETYYYRLDPTNYYSWVDYQCVTDYGTEVGGYPTVAVSTNKIHVSYNSGYASPSSNRGVPHEREKNGDAWQTPQTIPTDDNTALERVAVRGSKLLDFYYQFNFNYGDSKYELYVRERDLNGTTWSSGTLLCTEYASPDKLVSKTVTNDGKIHVLYSRDTGPARYRNYDGTTWSSETALNSLNVQVSANKINSVSNDLFVVWKDTYDGYLKYNQYDAAPLTPQNLNASLNTNGTATISWSANNEPDMTSGYYKIYRATTAGNEPTSYSLYATINAYSGSTPVTSWTDDLASSPSGLPRVFYKITAVDNSSLESSQSQYYAINNYYLNGTLNANMTLTTSHLIGTELVVPSGVTLNIESGANVNFASSGALTVMGDLVVKSNLTIPVNSTMRVASSSTSTPSIKLDENISLTVHGVLSAQGNSTHKGLFDRLNSTGYFGYIVYDGCTTDPNASYTNTLFQFNIKHSSGIKILNSDLVVVAYTAIDSCVQGIYIENSSPTIYVTNIRPNNNAVYGSGLASPYINSCVFHKESGYYGYHSALGVYLTEYMCPSVSHNMINGFDIGMYYGGTSAVARLVDDQGYYTNPNNQIYFNNTGIMVGWGGYCWGGYLDDDNGYNSIYYNTRDLYCYNNSTIMAEGNYWGGGNPTNIYCDNTSYISYAGILDSDPWDPDYSIKTQNNQTASVNQMKKVSKKDIAANLRVGFDMEKNGKFDDAIAHYKNMFDEDVAANVALTKMALLSRKFKKGDIKPYLRELLNTKSAYSNQVNSLLANITLQDGNYQESMNLYDEIIKVSPDSYEGICAKFDKLFAALHTEKNIEKAQSMLEELQKISITDPGLLYRLQIADNFVNGSSDNNVMNKKLQKSISAIEMPKAYALYANYPNPFNPSTIIKYQIPNAGFVSIMIYDAIGREVKTLLSEVKEKGTYEITFDGSGLTSGMYFYQLKAGSFTATKKMLLLK